MNCPRCDSTDIEHIPAQHGGSTDPSWPEGYHCHACEHTWLAEDYGAKVDYFYEQERERQMIEGGL